jgi:alanyl-tRNA synthetase
VSRFRTVDFLIQWQDMKHADIRKKFIDFFAARGHAVVPSSSLLPNDPSVLFTTAGMQQFKPYYADPSIAPAKNATSIQKCVRTSDIDEVGDERHLTFFEMLGNFSFGGYFKQEAIRYAYDFITKEMGLTIDYVSIFAGQDGVPADTESEQIWKSIDPMITVKAFGRADNFWGPTGDEGPCGPTTEVYVGGIEIWNIVFNEYYKKPGLPFEALAQKGIDTGMGLERLAMAAQRAPTVFETDLFAPIMHLIPESVDQRTRRIVADHARAIAFMICDGVVPSNKDQGYVLRRLMRRAIVHEHLNKNTARFDLGDILNAVIAEYHPFYPELDAPRVQEVFTDEEVKFSKTLRNGLRELEKLPTVDATAAFMLYESYGLPYEILKELGGEKASSLTRAAFDAKFKEHQEKSRAGAEKKFGGHGLLLDTGELKATDERELKIVTRLHTATHLLQAALRQVLGDQVRQAGSDITAERLRFDFTFPRKLTEEEIRKVEALVNDAITRDLPVTKITLPRDEAEKTGALHFFKIHYPEQVDVYSIGEFSKEFCGGPHVTHTGQIGRIAITKEEAVSAGVRRIRAVLTE